MDALAGDIQFLGEPGDGGHDTTIILHGQPHEDLGQPDSAEADRPGSARSLPLPPKRLGVSFQGDDELNAFLPAEPQRTHRASTPASSPDRRDERRRSSVNGAHENTPAKQKSLIGSGPCPDPFSVPDQPGFFVDDFGPGGLGDLPKKPLKSIPASHPVRRNKQRKRWSFSTSSLSATTAFSAILYFVLLDFA